MTKAIAKIYDGDSSTVIGVGFWVFPGFLLTCAHVVNQALSFAPGGREQPEGFVEIEFPNSETRVRLKGRVIRWYPADSGQREDDIAVLELSGPLPEDVKPMSLVLPTRVPLVTKGYPKDYDDRWGVSTDLTIGAGEVLNDLIQLENPNQRIAPGFSGAPVWEEGSDCAVGMIVLSQTDDGVAWMVSALVLRSVLGLPEMAGRSGKSTDSMRLTRTQKFAQGQLVLLESKLEAVEADLKTVQTSEGRQAFYERARQLIQGIETLEEQMY